jgi:16S rRNA (cytidine1402-2'-O)-methyltransferase
VVSEGLDMTVLPGPSAVLTALVAAGMAGEGFRFVGYLPRRARELESSLKAWRRTGGLLVAFDTGQRLARSLAVLAAHLPDARAAVCRELTKVHEEVVRGTVLELSERYPVPGPDAGPTGALRGEITLVLDLGLPLDDEAARRPDAAAAAGALLARGLSRRDTAAALHVCLGIPRREADHLTREVAARGG